MHVVFAQEPFPTSVTRALFLAGPTPRDATVPSWRPEALRELERRGYDGAVFVPEGRDWQFRGSYADQVDWELRGLQRADAVLFWIPRDLASMPGFTTNVEFGMWASSGKVALGAPPDAPKLTYLRAIAERRGIPQADTLAGTVETALALIGDGMPRSNGECDVPLQVFRTPSFQAWYGAQKRAGNVLDGARVEWVFRAGPRRDFIVYWALHVDVWVTAEGRRKKNEVVLARPDVAAVVLYHRDRDDAARSCVALVREFRSSVATDDAFVREVPAGSSFRPAADMLQVAVEEVHEEVGLVLPAARLRPVAVRQLAATMSAHKAHVYAAELSLAEMQALRDEAGTRHGADDGERTYVEVWTVEELLRGNAVDWSTLGMVLSVVGVAPSP